LKRFAISVFISIFLIPSLIGQDNGYKEKLYEKKVSLRKLAEAEWKNIEKLKNGSNDVMAYIDVIEKNRQAMQEINKQYDEFLEAISNSVSVDFESKFSFLDSLSIDPWENEKEFKERLAAERLLLLDQKKSAILYAQAETEAERTRIITQFSEIERNESDRLHEERVVFTGGNIKLTIGAFNRDEKRFPIAIQLESPELKYKANFFYSVKATTTEELKKLYLEFDALQRNGRIFGEIETSIIYAGSGYFINIIEAIRLKAVSGLGQILLYEEKSSIPINRFSGSMNRNKPFELNSIFIIEAEGAEIFVNEVPMGNDRVVIIDPVPGLYEIRAVLSSGESFEAIKAITKGSKESLVFKIGELTESEKYFNKEAATIKIGTILPISGPVAAYGIQTRDAILLAFEEINDAGGVLGQKLELITEDDEANPEKTTSAFKILTSQDKVNVIIGALTSKCSLAITSLSQAKKVVQISTSSTNDTVTDAGDFIFRACYNDSFQGQIIAKFAFETLKGKTAAVLCDISNDYSVGLTENFKKMFEALGGKMIVSESYNSGDGNFNAQLTKIKSAKPDVLFIPDYYYTVILIAKQARAKGMILPLLGADGWDEITSNAGDEALNGFYSNHYSPNSDDPAVKKFIASFKAKFGNDPNALAALGYDTAYLVAEAIKKAGTAKNSQKIRDAMASLDMQLVTGRIKFDTKRNPIKSAIMLEVVKADDGGLTTKFAGTVNP